MFGVHLPSISDVKNAVSVAASTALHTTEDLGSAAVSHAAALGREGLDLGRSAVTAVSHVDVQKVGATVTGAIGKAENWAENGIRTGVMDAGKGVHSAANFARSHITGNDPLSRLARGGITVAEDDARFQIGVVGGVGKAAVGLVGSVGQLSVMAAEYQYSPSARAAINDKIVGGVESGAKAVAGYAQSVAHDPTRVVGDVEGVAKAGAGWVGGEVRSAQRAVTDGHGPESFGMQVGNAATYLIPVGGEVRAAATVGELGARGLTTALSEDGTRALAETGTKALAETGGRTLAEGATSKAGVAAASEGLDGLAGVARRTGASESKLQDVLDLAKGDRPPPAYYLSPQRISEHRAAFDDGASRFTLKSSVDKYGLGQRDGTTFVMTRNEADQILKSAGDDPRALEQALGLPEGQLEGAELDRIDFTAQALDDLNVRMPSGNEAGANAQWLPGGYLPSGANEAVIDGGQAKAGQYTISRVD